MTPLMTHRLALAFLAALAAFAAPAQTLRSPDGSLALSLEPAPDAPAARLTYSIQLRGKPLITASQLGLRLSPEPSLTGEVRVVKITPSAADSTWTPVCGERASIRDHYRQWNVDLNVGAPARRFQLVIRAYDQGVAFRYVVPTQPGLDDFRVTEDLTEFRLPQDGPAFATYTAQGTYEKVPLSQIKPGCERPLVVETPGGPVVAFGEAALVDFARMKFQPVGEDQPGVRARLDGPATGKAPLVTPWRFMFWADTPAQLLERNDFILNLNEPNALDDVSWIRPGTVIRSGLTTEAGLACVDFAASNGLRFVLFDAGWYGPERDKTSDPTRVAHPGQLDLPAVIAHGKQRGIGVILYVNRIAAERQLDEMLPLYRQWGVAGVKFGFVRVGSQDATAWLHRAVRAAAAHQLMVDVHDEYRMTGYSRTYPHFMTAEGIGGDETHPAARDNVNLAFTRMLAGPADHTFCWMDNRIQNTLSHQLALPVVFFSPWQFLYWYDKPAAIKGAALGYWRNLPTTWDDTRVLDGKIGEFIVTARRSGEHWYVGVLNANQRRTLAVPLSFLPPGKTFQATLFTDGKPEGGGRTDVVKRTQSVTSATVLPLDCADNGGAALRIAP